MEELEEQWRRLEAGKDEREKGRLFLLAGPHKSADTCMLLVQ